MTFAPASAAARSAVLAVLIAALAFAAHAAAQSVPATDPADRDTAARLQTTVTAIAAGEDSGARRAAIVAALREVGVEPALESFGSGERAGVNVVVTLPGAEDARTLVIGAHYDRVAAGRGAVDNGAACAALVEVVRAVRASPLARSTLRVVFFDREETGLEGSRAHFAARASRPAYAINLDIFAYGDVLFATFSRADGPMRQALNTAAAARGVPVQEVPPERYPASDHLTMMQSGVETLGLAIVDRADVEAIRQLDVTRLKPGSGPRILTIIHTPNDTLDAVRPEQMAPAVAVVERLIRALD